MSSFAKSSPPLATDIPLPTPAPGSGSGSSSDSLPGVSSIPRLVYGTAWKEDRSASLVASALASGFRGVDTAAQPRHYREHLVGQGIQTFLSSSSSPSVSRADLYIQTKFTPSQLPNPSLPALPYDPLDPLEKQINDSVASSLRNLFPSTPSQQQELGQGQGQGQGQQQRGTTDEPEPYIDCLVLHSPLPTPRETLAAWRTLETLVPHPVRRLGLSNVPLDFLSHVWDNATIKPSVVQNRFFGGEGYAADVRAFCAVRGIVYQSFWTLTGNPEIVRSSLVSSLADAVSVDKEVVVYALVAALGNNCVLDGTTNETRMRADLEGLKKVEAWAAGGGAAVWDEALASFRSLVDATFEDELIM